MRDVRETIAHLIGLDAFEDVRVLQEKAPSGGVLIRYVLVPAHPIDRVAFEGALAVDEGDLRRLVVDELGPTPRAAQAGGATEALKRALPRPRVSAGRGGGARAGDPQSRSGDVGLRRERGPRAP